MIADIDPEGVETTALFAAADFRDARVLEIGCGGGRLTRRYVSATERVIGIDSSADSVIAAHRDRPRDLLRRLVYVRASGSELPIAGSQFDVVVFGWSL
jgi:ubiquinone/menaquinone biosynthesis C-methylase UbiE